MMGQREGKEKGGEKKWRGATTRGRGRS